MSQSHITRSASRLCCILIVSLLTFSTAVSAEESEHLLGDWGGLQPVLEKHGVTVESIFTLDEIGNVSGGIERKAVFLGNYDLTAEVDTEKAIGLPGGTIFAYMLADFGEAPSEFVGDLQASDNIETDESIKLYELWYDQQLFDGMLSVLVGLHDYNSEFYALEAASGLLNSSFGVGPDVSQVGPSIFATTSLATRIRIVPAEDWYVQGAIYDGIPGNPNNPRGTHIHLGDDDGIFSALELGRAGGEDAEYWKTAVGGWYHTAEYEDFSGELQDRNGGLYLIGEKRLYTEAENAKSGLSGFVQLGFARESRNQTAVYVGSGLQYTGLIPGREDDVLSLGVAVARNGEDYRDSSEEPVDGAETAIECNYRLSVTPYLSLTPDIQYIVNAGTSPAVDDAVVLGLRTEVAL